MEPNTTMCPENYGEMVEHFEEVYRNAFWALVNGADREALIGQIDEAIVVFQREMKTGELREILKAMQGKIRGTL